MEARVDVSKVLYYSRLGRLAAICLLFAFLTGGITGIVGLLILYKIFRDMLSARDIKPFEVGVPLVVAGVVLGQLYVGGVLAELFSVASVDELRDALIRFLAVTGLLWGMLVVGGFLAKKTCDRFAELTGFPAFSSSAKLALLGLATLPVLVGVFLLFIADVILYLGFARWGEYVAAAAEEGSVPVGNWAYGSSAR